MCTCHARRSTISNEYVPGNHFFDHYVPDVLREELYHGDGQIEDEVFVYGSFVQSKMYHNGVKCSDCHNSHTLGLKLKGNDLCLQCHETEYALETHHFHQENTEGSDCINCHMTGKLYMVNDYRRDHSFRVPRPDLSAEYNIPNACNNCHTDQSYEWSAEAVRNWYGKDRNENYADLLLKVRYNQFDSISSYVKAITDDSIPAIARATVIHSIQGAPYPEVISAINKTLFDKEPMVRIESVRYFDSFPLEERRNYLIPMLTDSMRTVRVAAAELLAGTNPDLIPEQYREPFRTAIREYQYFLQYNSDFKSGQLKIGNYHDVEGRPQQAEEAFQKALEIDPHYNPARLNLSLVLNRMGKNEEALEQYKTVIELEPEYGPVYFSAGLLLAEMNRLEEAANYIEKSIEKDRSNLRAYYNLGIIYQNLNRIEKAESVYLSGLEIENNYPELHHAITVLYLQNNRYQEAGRHLDFLISRFPENQQYIYWRKEIDQRLN